MKTRFMVFNAKDIKKPLTGGLWGTKKVIKAFSEVDILPLIDTDSRNCIDNSFGRTVSIHGQATLNFGEYSEWGQIRYDWHYSKGANNQGAGKCTRMYVLKGTPKEFIVNVIKKTGMNYLIVEKYFVTPLTRFQTELQPLLISDEVRKEQDVKGIYDKLLAKFKEEQSINTPKYEVITSEDEVTKIFNSITSKYDDYFQGGLRKTGLDALLKIGDSVMLLLVDKTLLKERMSKKEIRWE